MTCILPHILALALGYLALGCVLGCAWADRGDE